VTTIHEQQLRSNSFMRTDVGNPSVGLLKTKLLVDATPPVFMQGWCLLFSFM
jgi:hypothetical protein